MSHTEGKLTLANHGSIVGGPKIEFANGSGQRQFALVCVPGEEEAESGVTQEENARRLVACWNGCDGIDTEDLERWNKYCEQPMLQRGLQNMKCLDLQQKCDELVKALDVLERLSGLAMMEDDPVRVAARTVLARYPEGKS